MPVPEHKMTDEQKAMYTGISMDLTTEKTLRWSRSQMFIAINAVGFSFLGTQIGKPDTEAYHWVLGLAGLLLGTFWAVINWKTQQWINYWQACLKAMEPHERDLELVVFRVFSGKSWKAVNSFPTFHLLLNVLPIVFTGAWIVVGLIPVYQDLFNWFSNLFKGGA